MHDCPLRGLITSEECAQTIWRVTEEEMDFCRACEHGKKMAAASPFARPGRLAASSVTEEKSGEDGAAESALPTDAATLAALGARERLEAATGTNLLGTAAELGITRQALANYLDRVDRGTVKKPGKIARLLHEHYGNWRNETPEAECPTSESASAPATQRTVVRSSAPGRRSLEYLLGEVRRRLPGCEITITMGGERQ